jgi:release factor glutamine methyltransferase
LAYLLGQKEFWSLSFRVNRHTLIPRPETELLVDRVLMRTSGNESIAEIGTGPGNIAAAIASVRPAASITATDVSRLALRIAHDNLERLGINNVRLLHGSLFRPFREYFSDSKLDLILSNPPYISEEEWGRLPRSIRDHEPRRALVSGPTGLEIIAALIKESPPFLRTGGFLIFEIGFGQKDRVISLFPDSWSSVTSYNDINAIPRIIEARR